MSESRAYHECDTCQSYTIILQAIGGNAFLAKCENGHSIRARIGTTIVIEAMGPESDDAVPADCVMEEEPDAPAPEEQLVELQRALDARGRASAAAARGVFAGHVAEHLFPFSAPHGYHPKDIVHLGGVLDYVIFDGLHDIRHGNRNQDELTVVMADVKYNTSQSSKVQRAVLNALNDGRTRGEEWNVRDTTGLEYRKL